MLRVLVLTAVTAVLRSNYVTVTAMTSFAKATDFEVFGKVQGVFFRKPMECPTAEQMPPLLPSKPLYPEPFLTMPAPQTRLDRYATYRQQTSTTMFVQRSLLLPRAYTKEQAEKLGLRGWCKNTAQGTVLGHMQGPTEKVETMMHWLKTTGSPSSQIEKCEFRNSKDIEEYTFHDFDIRRDD